MGKILSTISGLFFLAVTNPVWSAVVSTGGDMSYIMAPASVEAGALESSTNFWAFNEKQSYTLTTDLLVDELLAASASGVISAGTTVNSYFIHADPMGDSTLPEDAVTLVGTITFDTPILGLIWSGVACEYCPASPMYIDASDYLGSASTIYPTGGLGRGMEMDDFYAGNGTQDFITISADGYSLTTVSSAALPLRSDQLRVITAVVPLPPAFWLLGTGLVALAGVGWRRKC